MHVCQRIRLAMLWAVVWLLLAPGCRTEVAQHAAAAAPEAGIEYVHLQEAAPWSIHVVAFDLAHEHLAVLAPVGAGVHGTETLPDMVARLPEGAGRPIAAINGDYFEFLTEPRYHGTLQGMGVVDGELVAGPAATTFWIDDAGRPRLGAVRQHFTITWPDGASVPFGLNCSTTDYKSEVRAANVVLFTPAFGASTNTEGGREYVLEPVDPDAWLPLRVNTVLQARVRAAHTAGNTAIPHDGLVISIARAADGTVPSLRVGDEVSISTTVTPDMTGVRAAVSGDPRLLVDGELVPGLDTNHRHPRTAVGYAGSRVVFVVVDGRQPNVSVGMTHRELADLMLRLGCTDALNLDGGGSTAMWYNGAIVNTPSSGRQRPVGNALVLVRRP